MSAVPVSPSPAINLRAGRLSIRYFDGRLWFGCYTAPARLGDPLVSGIAELADCRFTVTQIVIGSAFLPLSGKDQAALRSWLADLGIECLEYSMRVKGSK